MKNLFFALLVVFSASACAPEFGLEMQAPPVSAVQKVEPGGAEAAALRVKVGSFEDARSALTIVTVDDREIPTVGSVGGPVQEAFDRAFRDAGVRVVRRDAPLLQGEVVEWKANILPGFPSSEAVATAKVRVSLKDSESHVIYRGVFNGEATVSHPLLDEDHVQELLGQAMGGAVEAAVNDEVLRAQLSRGRIE